MTKCKSMNPENYGSTRCYLAEDHNGPHKDRQRGEWEGDGFWWCLVEDLIYGWNVLEEEESEPKPIATFTTGYGPRGR